MQSTMKLKNYWGYLLLAALIILLLYLLLESRQRTRKIDEVLKQQTIINKKTN
jgi:hypothetical protein